MYTLYMNNANTMNTHLEQRDYPLTCQQLTVDEELIAYELADRPKSFVMPVSYDNSAQCDHANDKICTVNV